jgi:tetratricopeptide (TPR) repeat protein
VETRCVVTAARLVEAPAGGLAKISLTVRRPGQGPRLLLADAGLVLRSGGAAFVPVPNQRAVLEAAESTVQFEALPLSPDQPELPAGSALKGVLTNEAGVLAVLRTMQGLEALEGPRLRRYLGRTEAGFAVDTRVNNRDVDLARWMRWTADSEGAAQATFPRDALRFALHAVTADYTIQQVADWLRLHRGLQLEPAMAEAWQQAHRTEFLLERAGLNHRVFSPNHADFHFNRGVDAYLLGDLAGAEKAFAKAEEASAGDVQARFAKGVAQYRAGRFDEAGATFLVATGLAGATADVFYNRGAVAWRQGDKLNAARNFRRALELEPKHPEATVWLHKADPEGRTAPAPEPPKVKPGRRGRRP